MNRVPIDLDEVRRHVIIALAADDELGELLVLKGGNALRLVHGIGSRASLDLDYSIEADLLDSGAIRTRIEHALAREFSSIRYSVFDVRIAQKPAIPQDQDQRPKWGGWAVEFKLIDSQKFDEFINNPGKLRDYSLELYEHKKSFQIDISKYEYVGSAQAVLFRGYSLRVYSPAMIVFEKLRALCQQMKDYPYVSHSSPRPRDFVDICAALDAGEDALLAERSIVRTVFAAKEVPLSFLGQLAQEMAFHQQGWPSVSAQMTGSPPFSQYFERVIAFVERLHALGVV
jgi:predicted nucleotidyltransferase component of viral defense system